MKTLIASAISLLVGLIIGCCIGYRYYDRHVMKDTVELMSQAMRSSERLDAHSAIVAIGLVESGQTQKTIRFLCRPIADYYYLYTSDGWPKDVRSVQLRTMIQQLVSTNKIVAEEMTNRLANYGIQEKIK
jgi:hypothetical protein